MCSKECNIISTYTQILFQIVIGTKHRQRVLIKSGREKLFAYIGELLRNKNCHPYKINGVADHLHIITNIHPSIALADLVKDIKLATSSKIKEENWFPDFSYWQAGYSAFTYSIHSKENLMIYVANQEAHHQDVSSLDEMKGLLKDNKIDFNERYLE